jgi:ADP-ribosylglycohydrolase
MTVMKNDNASERAAALVQNITHAHPRSGASTVTVTAARGGCMIRLLLAAADIVVWVGKCVDAALPK